MCTALDCSRLHKYTLQTIGLDLSNSACSQWSPWTLAAGLTKTLCYKHTPPTGRAAERRSHQGSVSDRSLPSAPWVLHPTASFRHTQKSISHGTVLSLIDSEYYFPFNMLIILQRITYKNKIIKLIMYTTQGLGVSNIFLKKIK